MALALALALACAAPAAAGPPPDRPRLSAGSAAPDGPADPVLRWHALIEEASARFGVPASWIERVMRAESGGRTLRDGHPITSRAGAMGLMQLMPATWAALRARLGLGADPFEPRGNVLAGAAYLRMMYERFGYPGLFAAYNAGPARYAAHLASGRPLPPETRAYLAALTGKRSGSPPVRPRAARPTLFAVLHTAKPDQDPMAAQAVQAASRNLFVVRSGR